MLMNDMLVAASILLWILIFIISAHKQKSMFMGIWLLTGWIFSAAIVFLLEKGLIHLLHLLRGNY